MFLDFDGLRLPQALFLFLSAFDQVVDALHQVGHGLLLLRQLLLTSVKVRHQLVELCIFGLIFCLLASVQEHKLLLKLFFGVRLVFLASVDFEEI